MATSPKRMICLDVNLYETTYFEQKPRVLVPLVFFFNPFDFSSFSVYQYFPRCSRKHSLLLCFITTSFIARSLQNQDILVHLCLYPERYLPSHREPRRAYAWKVVILKILPPIIFPQYCVTPPSFPTRS